VGRERRAHHAGQPNPSDPFHGRECTERGEGESRSGGDEDEDGSASAVKGDGVEGGGETDESGSNDEDHELREENVRRPSLPARDGRARRTRRYPTAQISRPMGPNMMNPASETESVAGAEGKFTDEIEEGGKNTYNTLGACASTGQRCTSRCRW
jgi:hypothetical protein